jgi:hypothetical protein
LVLFDFLDQVHDPPP